MTDFHQDYISHVVKHIPGFTSPEFLTELYRMALGKRMVVEIGAFKGRSTAVLAKACSGLVYSIDIWDNRMYSPDTFDEKDGYATSIDKCLAYRIWFHNMRLLGVDTKVLPMIGNSHWLERYFPPKSIDLLFVDGDHSEHMVLKDLQLYLPKLGDGGVMCGDDYDMPSVRRPVDAMAMTNGFRVETFDGGKGWVYR